MNLSIASEQWFKRPDSERFLTLQALLDMTQDRAARSSTSIQPNTHLIADISAEGAMVLDSDAGILAPNHWSMGQLCSLSHVPAKMVRELAEIPNGPQLCAHAINMGIRHLVDKDNVQLLVTQNGVAEMRAMTSESYGRIYDVDVVKAVIHANEACGNRWHIPSASYAAQNPLRATTLYGDDRSVFIFLVDEKNPIEIGLPAGGTRTLFRGFITHNSEVGAATFGLLTFLYDYCCDNRTIWGAEDVRTLTVRHTSGGPARFEREAAPALMAYAEASAADTKATLERAARFEVGATDEKVLDFLATQKYSKPEARRIVESADAEEGGSNTLWQLINGATALARAIPFADDRLAAEKRASGMLRRVA